MSSTHIEIPVREIDFHIKSTEQTFTLQYLIIGPYSEDQLYADNQPYLSISTLSILISKKQINEIDWDAIMNAIKKNDAFMELITPNELDNIIVFPKTVYFNKYLDVFEFCATFGKGEQQND